MAGSTLTSSDLHIDIMDISRWEGCN